jgi:hypothetical protein
MGLSVTSWDKARQPYSVSLTAREVVAARMV